MSDIERVPQRIAGIRTDAVYRKPDDGSIWRVVSIFDRPTMTLEQVHPTEGFDKPLRTSGAIGSPIFNDFEELVPDPEVQAAVKDAYERGLSDATPKTEVK